jgi:ATP-dependent Lhr-like helicase
MLDPLDAFSPRLRAWFRAEFAAPTDVQARSWPVIRAGGHVLITAPTGTGKTLTAFLGALDDFAAGRLAPGATRVLYVSPLKALNTDIARNLTAPLAGLARTFAAAGETFPPVRVATRSGDTPQNERQRLLRRPPEILVTTPESLQLLLTSARGRAALATVERVIIDEVHAIADNRRGVVLAVCLERISALAGDFQRVALSATVHPLDVVAAFVAGCDANGRPRAIEVVRGGDAKHVVLDVVYPPHVRDALEAGEKIWDPLARSFRELIARHRSTLFFVNSRRLAEKITLKINEGADGPVAYAHHGSLAREIRAEVEGRFKSGELRAIVATSSLEMGIDIGTLDEVALVQSPPSVASTLQRIGRAGHRVDAVSHATLFPTHGHDFVDAAALAAAVEARDIEPLRPIEAPLDVLAQTLVSLTATQPWPLDDLYALLRRSYCYRRLDRAQFDAVVEMLAGRYSGSRIRGLAPRLVVDRLAGTAAATRGAVYALYSSGGTIPDRGYYRLRHADTGAAIGELDEEFVWEATVGQVFSLGAQHWQIRRITHNDVLAAPARSRGSAPPFWRAEDSGRSFHYSGRIAGFLEDADSMLAHDDGCDTLTAALRGRHFDADAARELVDLLVRQREHTGAALPHRHHLLIEDIAAAPGGYRGPVLDRHLVLHTFWGARVNRPLAIALRSVLTELEVSAPEIYADDDAIVVQAQHVPDVDALLDRITATDLDALLRRSLESSGYFGARFRECAGRALLLTRSRFNERLPLWLSRLHAKKLLTNVARYPDFPILLETWRTCLVDEFEVAALKSLLGEIARGEITTTRVATATPSPFAAQLAWGQIASSYMYADDSPELTGQSALSDDLIRAAVYDATLRPRIAPDVIATFVAKRQRRESGYAPLDGNDLGEWLKERVLLDAREWEALAGSVDTAPPHVRFQRDEREFVVHLELARTVGRVFFGETNEAWPAIEDERDAADLAREILSFEGPLPESGIAARVPLSATSLGEVLRALTDEGALVGGPLVAGDETFCWCDAENLDILLRLQRARQRPQLEPRPLAIWPGFMAAWHRFGTALDESTIADRLEQLRAFSAPVAVWLDDLLSARHAAAQDHDLDTLLAQTDTVWLGRGEERITFAPREEAGLLATLATHEIDTWFRDPRARYPFFVLADQSGLDLRAASAKLWQAAWAGAVTADSVAPLRRGLTQKYELPGLAAIDARPSLRPPARRRSGAMAAWPGNWSPTPRRLSEVSDPLTQLEDAKARARILLDRYGILAREFCNRESEEFRWSGLFRALRVMELAGEVAAGLFLTGLSGPQFAVPAALRALHRHEAPATWWVAAQDPAAPCGLGVDWPGQALPARRTGNYLAFAGADLVVTAENGGRRLAFAPEMDETRWPAVTALLTHLLSRRRAIALDRIDDEAPERSPHLAALGDWFTLRRDHRGIELTLGA